MKKINFVKVISSEVSFNLYIRGLILETEIDLYAEKFLEFIENRQLGTIEEYTINQLIDAIEEFVTEEGYSSGWSPATDETFASRIKLFYSISEDD